MERFLFMRAVIDRLGERSFVRKASARALRVLAAVAAVGGLAGAVNAFRLALRLEASALLGGFLYALLFAAGVYMAVHAALIRATDVEKLPDTEFAVLPVASVVFLLAGEAYGAFAAAASAGGGVLIWFAGWAAPGILRETAPFLPPPEGATFASGIRYIVAGGIRAVLAVGLGRLLSELLIVAERAAGSAPVPPTGAGSGGPPP